jgi:hypothetical protein
MPALPPRLCASAALRETVFKTSVKSSLTASESRQNALRAMRSWIDRSVVAPDDHGAFAETFTGIVGDPPERA